MSEAPLPTPAFAVPFTAYRPTVDVVGEKLPCPDCLGTKLWKVVAPSGAEHEVNCPRCSDPHSHKDFPALVAKKAVGRVDAVTFKGVIARSAVSYSEDDRVTYYSDERCCGTTVREKQIGVDWSLDRDFAEGAAAALAALKQNELNVDAFNVAAHKFERLTFADATLIHRDQETWVAIWRYSHLRDAIKELANPDPEKCDCGPAPTVESLIEGMKEALGFDARHGVWTDRATVFAAARDAVRLRTLAPLDAVLKALTGSTEEPAPSGLSVRFTCKDDADLYASTYVVELPIRDGAPDLRVGATVKVGRATSLDHIKATTIRELVWSPPRRGSPMSRDVAPPEVVEAFAEMIGTAVRCYCADNGKASIAKDALGMSLAAMTAIPPVFSMIVETARMLGKLREEDGVLYPVPKAAPGRKVNRFANKPERMRDEVFEVAHEMCEALFLGIEEGKIKTHTDAGDALAVAFAMLLNTFDIPDRAVAQFGGALTGNAHALLAKYRAEGKK